MSVSDDLFISLSRIVGVRVTPSNLRSVWESVGSPTGKNKSDIILEILVAITRMEEIYLKSSEK